MGIAKLQLKYSHILSMLGTRGLPVSDLILVFAALPPGSRIVGTTEAKNVDTYTQMEFLIENPLFRDGAFIDFDWERDFGVNSDGSLKEFSVFKGLSTKDLIFRGEKS